MTAHLPASMGSGHEPSAEELNQILNGARWFANVAVYNNTGGTLSFTGSATTNTLVGPSVPFVKLGSAAHSYILCFVSVSLFFSAGPNFVVFGVGTGNGVGGNTDTDIVLYQPTVLNHHAYCFSLGAAIVDAGSYSMNLYYRVGGGTITLNNGDAVSMAFLEVPYA